MTERLQERQACNVYLGYATGDLADVLDRILAFVPAPLRVSKERRERLVPWLLGAALLAILAAVALTEVIH